MIDKLILSTHRHWVDMTPIPMQSPSSINTAFIESFKHLTLKKRVKNHFVSSINFYFPFHWLTFTFPSNDFWYYIGWVFIINLNGEKNDCQSFTLFSFYFYFYFSYTHLSRELKFWWLYSKNPNGMFFLFNLSLFLSLSRFPIHPYFACCCLNARE